MAKIARSTKIRTSAVATLLSFVGLGFLIPVAEGRFGMIFKGVMVALGLGAAFLVYRFLSRSLPKEAPSDAVQRELLGLIDRLFAEARSRLKESKLADRGRNIGRLPMVIVTGPRGSTKTSLVEVNGVNTERLAGEPYRGEAVTETEAANIWLGDGVVFVEAGGRLLDEPTAWARLLRHLRPRRAGAVLGRGAQASRVALLCFPCDRFMEPGWSESIPAAARELRERLVELTAGLGIHLPVYVVFTKADRLRYFEDYVRHLDEAEIGEVLGATFPLELQSALSGHTDRQTRRVAAQFDAIVRALAARRVDLLEEESDPVRAAGIYEFPRELSKLQERVTRFLVDLSRPSQLSSSPLLRGFYFTGVRPVVLEGAQPVQPEPSAAGPVDASRLFKAGGAPEPTPAATQGRRRIPQWVFVRRFFRDVVLSDHAAMSLTGGGSRVNFLRRVLVAAAIAFGGFLIFVTTRSFIENRDLLERTAAGLVAAEGFGTDGAGVDAAELRRLESLRDPVESIRDHVSSGAPMRLRWGLYSGQRVFAEARREYFERFDAGLGQTTNGSLLERLADIPTAPTPDDFDPIYDALKAHLQMTSYGDSATAEFLVPVLGGHRPGDRDDADETMLADAQFAFFARELRDTTDLRGEEQGDLVQPARTFLQAFTGPDRFYQSLLSAASEGNPAVRFPGIGPLRANHVVPGAFTRAGWESVRAQLADLASFTERDAYVIGPGAEVPPDELRDELLARYAADYVEQWRSLLADAVVSGQGTAGTANALASIPFPMLRLLETVSDHTADLDLEEVDTSFQPVHAVVPRDTTEVGVQVPPQSGDYVEALRGLGSALDAWGDDRNSVANQDAAVGAAEGLEQTVDRMGQNFSQAARAPAVGATLATLLKLPARGVEARVRGAPRDDANGAGQRLCTAMGEVAALYPFTRGAGRSATIDAVDAALMPGQSIFSNFENDFIGRGLIEPIGTSAYRAVTGGRMTITDEALAYLNAGKTIQRALYGQGEEIRVSYILNLEPSEALGEVVLNIDTRSVTFRPAISLSNVFTWTGSPGGNASFRPGPGSNVSFLPRETRGVWAIHELLDEASWERRGGGNEWTLRWQLDDGSELQGYLSFPQVSVPILRVDQLQALRGCPSTFVR